MATVPRRTLAAAAIVSMGVLGLGGAALVTSDDEAAVTAAPAVMGCEDWDVQLTSGECFAAGVIRYISLHNLQGSAQFCKWRPANPGEWGRLRAYAETGVTPTSIVTWFGGSINNQLQAYFATGAPAFQVQPNTAPNRCRTPLPPPVLQSVTPGQTDATVTLED